jgi:drug/metabolite transporter (DMT)-like permease
MAGTINLYSIGLNYASATSSSAIFNIVPVVAFILAVMFRSDKNQNNLIVFSASNNLITELTNIDFLIANQGWRL